MLTYKIVPDGHKFATVCRTDGYWSITWYSKTKKAAKRKGDDFLAGKRTATRHYRTRHAEMCDMMVADLKRREFLHRIF